MDVPRSTYPSTSPILSTSSTPHTTPTSPHSDFPQLDIPSIFTISYLEIAITIPTYIPSSLAPISSTPPIIISPLSVEVPISQSQPKPLVSVQEGTISTTDEMTDFGEDIVVSLRKYFWNKKEKSVVKKGAKRTRERTGKQVETLNHII